MSVTSGADSNATTPKLRVGCPYIGMINDPQTHIGVPDARNCCHLVNPPSVVTLTHQQGFCLGTIFPECPVYQSSGSEPPPGGVFEGTEANERGFGLPFLAARRAQSRTSKSATEDIKTKPIPEQEPEAKVVSGPEPAPDLVGELSSDGKKPILTGQVVNIPAVPVVAATVAASDGTADVFPEISNEPFGRVKGDATLRQRPYSDTSSRSKKVKKKKARKNIWGYLLVGAIVVMFVAIWAIYTGIQNQNRTTQLNAENSYTISLATAVQDMGAAAEAWGTAASILESQQSTATSSVFTTQTAVQAAAVARQTAQVATSTARIATPTQQAAICQNVNDANLYIVSGPDLLPVPGTLFKTGMDSPQASWVIQNTGKCSWSQILVWSVLDNAIVEPIIKRNGEIVTSVPGGDQEMIKPGEQIEVVLQFPATGAQRVNGEWALVVDGLSLVPQSHLILNATNWIVLRSPPTATPTRVIRTPQPGGGGGIKPPIRP